MKPDWKDVLRKMASVAIPTCVECSSEYDAEDSFLVYEKTSTTQRVHEGYCSMHCAIHAAHKIDALFMRVGPASLVDEPWATISDGDWDVSADGKERLIEETSEGLR